MQIGKKIAYIRILKGIKQQSLAKELGISQQAVSKKERKKERGNQGIFSKFKGIGFFLTVLIKIS